MRKDFHRRNDGVFMPMLPDTEDDLLAQRKEDRTSKSFNVLFALMVVITVVLVCFAIYLTVIMVGWFPAWGSSQSGPDTPQVVTTPNLVGLDYIHAQRAAEDVGCSLEVINAFIDGTVTKQSPSAGAKVVQGSSILVEFALTTKPTAPVGTPPMQTSTPPQSFLLPRDERRRGLIL